MPHHQDAGCDEDQVEEGTAVIFIEDCGDRGETGFDVDEPEDFFGFGHALQDAEHGEDGAIDDHDAQQCDEDGASRDADPDRAGHQPDAAVNEEYTPGLMSPNGASTDAGSQLMGEAGSIHQPRSSRM